VSRNLKKSEVPNVINEMIEESLIEIKEEV